MTSPVSDAMIEAGLDEAHGVGLMAERREVEAIYLAMKAKEEAAGQLTDKDKDELYELAKEQAPEILTDQSPADEVETRFWSIVDRDGLTGLPSDMWAALETLVSRAAAIRNGDEGVGS